MSTVRVFIAGSRALPRLNDALRQRLDRIISEEHAVLVGDASGADRAVQQYFAGKHYPNVTVYCTGGNCRHNVGQWATAVVAPPAGVRGGFDFYAAKDREMALHASHGLMLWDGESRGTLTNIRNLVDSHKPVVVYLSPAKTFVTVKTSVELDDLLAQAVSAGRHSLHQPA